MIGIVVTALATIFSSILMDIISGFLWRVALIIFGPVAILWLVRRWRRGRGESASKTTDTVLVVPVLCIGVALGYFYGGVRYAELERETLESKHASEIAKYENVLDIYRANEDRYRAHMIKLRTKIEDERKKSEKSNELSRQYIERAQQLSVKLKRLQESSDEVSKLSNGSIPVVPDDWVRVYNEANGFSTE